MLLISSSLAFVRSANFIVLFCITFCVSSSSTQQNDPNHSIGTGIDDLIRVDIPGLNFKPTFQQYSGYLNATDGKHLFYWLVESQNDSANDPLLLWLQGGPGCSALGGFMTELGPFHLNPGSDSLWENVFSWNKFANVLFVESPSGVGYSYSSPPNDTTDDDATANHNFYALRDFFYNKFPEYQNRDFYITGESYAGVYIPTLAKRVIDGIAAKQFPDNLRGVAIGNGILSEPQQLNSLVNLLYFHGIIGDDQWNSILDACCPNQTSYHCDFYSQINEVAISGNETPVKLSSCTEALFNMEYEVYVNRYINDLYNMYQDCYSDEPRPPMNNNNPRRSNLMRIKQLQRFKLAPIGRVRSFAPGVQDMSHQINYDSTDANFGYQCWANSQTYFNRLDVKKALNVAEEMWNNSWCECCSIRYRRQQQYYDMNETFSYILQNSNINILIYNGDVDLVCNFLGDEWFIERQVVPENDLKVVEKRKPWIYRNQVAGFVKRFERIDLLTVKGSGHFVPEDRPGPALQMIVNFVKNTRNYSQPADIDVTPKTINKITSAANSISNAGVIGLVVLVAAQMITLLLKNN